MLRAAAGHGVVVGGRLVAARVAADYVVHAVELFEHRLDAPEAPAGDHRLRDFRLRHGLTHFLEVLVLHELQRLGVQAEAQPRRARAVVEEVAQVRIAPRAVDLRADHAVAEVRLFADVLTGDGLEEARPAGARLELRIRAKERQVAPDAQVHARFLVLQQPPAKRGFGAGRAGDAVLLRGQPLLPLLLGSDDLGHDDGPGELALWIDDADVSHGCPP